MFSIIERSGIEHETMDKIIFMFKNNTPIMKIASLMRMRDYMVRCILIENKYYSGRNTLDGYAKSDILRDKKDGVDNATLAKMYYVPEKTIDNLCVKNGFKKRNHSLSKGDIENIINDYKNGSNVFAISKMYNVSYGTIKRHIGNAGIEVKKNNNPEITESEKKDIIRDYQNNVGMKTLAKKYSYGVKVIKEILVDNNIQIMNGKVTEEMVDGFVELYESGDVIKSISYQYDVSDSVVLTHLRKRGVHIRREHHRLTIDERKLLQKDKKHGMTEDELMDKYKVHKLTVRNILKEVRKNG